MNADNCQSTCSHSRYRVPACWLVLIIFDFCLMAFAFAQDSPSSEETRPVQVMEIRIPGPQDVTNNAIRFEAIDVFVDSGHEHLAAWQLELISRTKDVEIVGIEGGEHPAFKEPPYYDPRAMNNNRVILGAFSMNQNEQLPSGRSRVARVHVQITGPGERLWQTELTTAASSEGKKITAELSIAKAQG